MQLLRIILHSFLRSTQIAGRCSAEYIHDSLQGKIHPKLKSTTANTVGRKKRTPTSLRCGFFDGFRWSVSLLFGSGTLECCATVCEATQFQETVFLPLGCIKPRSVPHNVVHLNMSTTERHIVNQNNKQEVRIAGQWRPDVNWTNLTWCLRLKDVVDQGGTPVQTHVKGSNLRRRETVYIFGTEEILLSLP